MAQTITMTRRAYEKKRLPGNIIGLVILIIMSLTFLSDIAPNKPAANLAFPALTGRVVDEAGILPPATITELTNISRNVEAKSGAQLVVATVKDLQGTSIEDYGYQLGRFWSIGDKDRNDGALLIVAPNEREVRIEVGYGLEGTLTDAMSNDVIQTTILPLFREGDMAAGTLAGAKRIADIISTEGAPTQLAPEDSTSEEQGHDTLMTLVIGLIMSIFGMIPASGIYRFGRTLVDENYANQMVTITPSSNDGGWGSGGGGRGGGGRSGGGFSGGGGSFGGGGSSGRW